MAPWTPDGRNLPHWTRPLTLSNPPAVAICPVCGTLIARRARARSMTRRAAVRMGVFWHLRDRHCSLTTRDASVLADQALEGALL